MRMKDVSEICDTEGQIKKKKREKQRKERKREMKDKRKQKRGGREK
jgi:hypothetical protein